MNKTSVIIPVYNRENTIKRCLKNIVLQKDANEIILVNDGSTDNTLNVLKELEKSDKRIKVISQENKGPLSARKTGLEYSTGNRICFIDSDDTVSRNYISELNKTMDEKCANIVFSKIALHPGMLPLYIIYNTYRPKDNFTIISENKDDLPKLNVCFHSSMYKREYANLEDYNLKANEDLAITAYLYQNADRIGFNDKAVYHLYQSKNSISKEYITDGIEFYRIENVLLPLRELYKKFESNNLINKYYLELEIIFIKNIFQAINRINSSKILDGKKAVLIKYLLGYLSFYFPNWKQNKILESNFKGYSLGDVMDFKNGLKSIKNINEYSICDYDYIKENYDKVLKK